MKNTDNLFYIILITFASIAFLSLVLILSKTKLVKKPSILGAFKAHGVFLIEANPQVGVTNPFNVRIIADSDKKEANAVALFLEFDPQKLSVLSVDTSSSFCQFYPENKSNNNLGTVSIQCGAPSPGFKGKNTIASIDFMPKMIGETDIKISEKSMILLNNGKGDNIFSSPETHRITILNTI